MNIIGGKKERHQIQLRGVGDRLFLEKKEKWNRPAYSTQTLFPLPDRLRTCGNPYLNDHASIGLPEDKMATPVFL